MNLISRFLWFPLIFQILALSSIPPSLSDVNNLHGKAALEKQIRVGDDSGLPGQFGGFVKNEQDIFTEDDTEDFHHFQGFIRESSSDLSLIDPGLRSGSLTFTAIRVPLDVALFIMFHCWKLDLFID
jgi:hypothetical protein